MNDLSLLESLSLYVKEAREHLELTQLQAARIASIGVASWRRVEQCQQVKASTLRAMAKALNLPDDELIRRASGEPPALSTLRGVWEASDSHSGLLSPTDPDAPGAETRADAALSPDTPGVTRLYGESAAGLSAEDPSTKGSSTQRYAMERQAHDASRLASGIAGDIAEVGLAWQVWGADAPGSPQAEAVVLEPALRRLYALLNAASNLVPVEAVAQICGEPNAPEYLARLREHGLVSVETIAGKDCVRVLAQDDAQTLARRHAEYFCSMTLQIAAQPFLPDTPSIEEQLRPYYAHLERALTWYLAHGDVETTLRFAVALAHKPIEGSTFPQTQQWLMRALARPGAEKPTLWRARALMALAYLSDFAIAERLHKECLKLYRRLGEQGEAANTLRRMAILQRRGRHFGASRKLFERSIALYEEIQNKLGCAAAYNSFANLECEEQNYATARALYEQARTIYVEEGDHDRLAGVLENIGNLAFQAQQYDRARDYYEQSLDLRRQFGLSSNYADSFYNLGDVAMYMGRYREAENCFRSALTRFRDAGGGIIAEVLEGYAALKLKQEQAVCATRLFGAAQALRETFHNPAHASERLGYTLDVNAARAALNRDEFEAEWQAGREMSMQEALQYALDTPSFSVEE